MAAPERLVEVWAAGADGRGKSGSGWIVGRTGVLSCRHVLEPFLRSAPYSGSGPVAVGTSPVLQVRRADATSASAWIDCVVAWQHPSRDLALLEVSPPAGQSWVPPAERSPRLAGLGRWPTECVATGFPDAEIKATGLRGSEQAPGRLLPGGAARDPDGLIAFDVHTTVPDDCALWSGFSGSAVHDAHWRLVGVVVKVASRRKQRRLLVLPVDDNAVGPTFSAVASKVGCDPAIEDQQAPLWRRSVDHRALTRAGVPASVAEIDDLRVFGVHVPSSGASACAHPSYLDRDKDIQLRAALAEAAGYGRRIVLVVGDSAAGKSRSACEVLRKDPVLRSWRLVVPMVDGGLSRLASAGLGWQHTVLWLDDLDKFLGRGLDIEILRQILADDPTVAVVATIRTSQLQARQSELSDPAWEFLTNASEVTRVDLEASLSASELDEAAAKISDLRLLHALREGVGLGEWLVAGPELMKKLAGDHGLNRAFADIVIAWYRTGLDEPLFEQDARRLWADALAPAMRQRLFKVDSAAQADAFERASAWACKPVLHRDLYEQALVTKLADGYVAHDYVVDQVVRSPERAAVPDAVWHHALRTASAGYETAQGYSRTWEVGVAADRERAVAHALTAMQVLAEAGSPNALFNVGVLLGQLDRSEEAVGVYDEVVARFGDAPEPALREQVAKARSEAARLRGSPPDHDLR